MAKKPAVQKDPRQGEPAKGPHIKYVGNGKHIDVPASGQVMTIEEMEEAGKGGKSLETMTESQVEAWLNASKSFEEWDERALEIKRTTGLLPGRVQMRLISGRDPEFSPMPVLEPVEE